MYSFFQQGSWAWGTVLLILQLAALLHILASKRRNPGQAVFWLLLLTLLPPLGLIFYLLLGINRFEHVRSRIIKARSSIGSDGSRFWTELLKLNRSLSKFQSTNERSQSPHMTTLDRIFPENSALEGNHIEMLIDGSAVYPRMLADIRKAEKCIRLQSYIFNSDEVGRMFMQALQERAAAGVDVKVLFDSVGSIRSFFSQYFRKLLHKGSKNFCMKAFSPVNLLAPWKYQLRNHRKLLVIDGRIVYVGGVNIAAENMRFKRIVPARYIHDLHCRITGPAASQFTLSFLADYLYASGSSNIDKAASAGDLAPVERCGNASVRVIPGGPGNIREATGKLFFTAAALAQKSLWIMTPYFVPGKDYVDALCMAAARGVDVKIIVPHKGDHLFVDYAMRNYFEQLNLAGVTVYEKLGTFSHIKALLVDSQWGFMGSSNCDSRSFYLNFELDFCFEGSDFTTDMIRQFYREIAGARKLTAYRLSKTPRWKKLLYSIAALFTPVL